MKPEAVPQEHLVHSVKLIYNFPLFHYAECGCEVDILGCFRHVVYLSNNILEVLELQNTVEIRAPALTTVEVAFAPRSF